MEMSGVKSDPVRQQIEDAVTEGDYLEAARLWQELVGQNAYNEGLRVEEIGALCLAHAWQDAEDRAAAAIADFPKSIYMRLAQANISYLSFNWGVAVERYEQIRRVFDPIRFHESLNTVLVQLHCHEMMSEYENARRLADAFWPLLRKSSFTFRHESLLLGTLLPPERRSQHLAWVSRAMPRRFRENFHKRERLASRNSSWMRQRARGVKILSLGQNCLPWMLPNRWGLRPDDIDMKPMGPFDYFPAIADKTAEALDRDFEPFLPEAGLWPFITGTKIPALMNDAMQASFFHETGSWWGEDNWARLKSAYRERIVKFKNSVRCGPALYVYAICGAASVERIVDSYYRVLHDDNSRLLIINLLKDPFVVDVSLPHVRLAHIPYPEDYTWTQWEEFTSDRGIAFELEIVREIIEQIRQLTGDGRAKPPSDQVSVLEAFRNVLSRVAFR
jgi:hypothetical protein